MERCSGCGHFISAEYATGLGGPEWIDNPALLSIPFDWSYLCPECVERYAPPVRLRSARSSHARP